MQCNRPVSAIVTHDLYSGRKPLPRPKLLLYTLMFAVVAGLFIRHQFPPLSLNTIAATALLTALFYVVAKIRLGKLYYADVMQDGRDALLRRLGGRPQQLDLDAVPSLTRRGPVVTGAAYDGSWLYIIEDGVCAQIPFALVRSWQWRIEAYKDPEIHVNVTVNGAHAGPALPDFARSTAVARGIALAKLASGLTIQVADVGKPTWRFTTDNRAALERWHEILTQMREGKLAVQ